jgi:hypothetical protein
MDDMSKYLTALGQSSEAVSKVDSENANLVGQANAYNLKLRNIHSEAMGATDPVGIALVAKGAEKVGAKVVNNVVSKQSQGINDQINTITQRGQARLAGNNASDDGPIDAQTGLTADESSQLDNLASQSKLIGNFQSSTEAAVTPNAPATTAVTDGVETGTESVAATEAGTTAVAATTEGSLVSATAASTADDWNPVGIVTTIGLGLATLFAGIFGHKKEEVARHVQTMNLNPSTQFGV